MLFFEVQVTVKSCSVFKNASMYQIWCLLSSNTCRGIKLLRPNNCSPPKSREMQNYCKFSKILLHKKYCTYSYLAVRRVGGYYSGSAQSRVYSLILTIESLRFVGSLLIQLKGTVSRELFSN